MLQFSVINICSWWSDWWIVSRTGGGACSIWQWWHWWWGFTQPFIHSTEPGQPLHHIIQLRQWVKTLFFTHTHTPPHTLYTQTLSLIFLRWRGSRLEGHGYGDHQQWGGAGVPSGELLRCSGDVGGRRRRPRPNGEPHGRPRHAPLVPGLVYQGESGGPAQYRPRGLPELSVAGDGGWMVGDAQKSSFLFSSVFWFYHLISCDASVLCQYPRVPVVGQHPKP